MLILVFILSFISFLLCLVLPNEHESFEGINIKERCSVRLLRYVLYFNIILIISLSVFTMKSL